MKALYHALPMDYVTITKLQNKFKGQVNQGTVRKLMDKMASMGLSKLEAQATEGSVNV